MNVESLQIPALLLSLLDAGVWPSDQDAVNRQNLHSLIPRNRSQKLRRIILFPPPFSILSRTSSQNLRFYHRYGASHELNLDLAIDIGDFGVGSDSPFLLYYCRGNSDPAVITLEWPGNGEPNHWVELSPDFESFVSMLGL